MATREQTRQAREMKRRAGLVEVSSVWVRAEDRDEVRRRLADLLDAAQRQQAIHQDQTNQPAP